MVFLWKMLVISLSLVLRGLSRGTTLILNKTKNNDLSLSHSVSGDLHTWRKCYKPKQFFNNFTNK